MSRFAAPTLLLLLAPAAFAEDAVTHLTQYGAGEGPTIVDGEYFSWYGARTAEGVRYAARKVRKLKQIRDAARGA